MLDEGQGVGGGDVGILDALPDLVDLHQLQPQEFQVICFNSKSNMYFLTKFDLALNSNKIIYIYVSGYNIIYNLL